MANAENLSPHIIARLGREISDVVKKPIDGVTLWENEDGGRDMDKITEVSALMTGPVDPAFDDHPCFISISPADTPYEGGGWCVKLILGTEYPAAPPRGYFMTKIFHPNIASNGGICVNALKKDWTQTMTLSHIFQVIRCLLIVPFPESSLNDEAGKLFMTSYDEYHRRAKLMTAVHAIPASKFPPSVKTGLSDGKCPPQSSLKARVNMADSSLGKIASESPGYQPTKKMKAKETKRKKALKRL